MMDGPDDCPCSGGYICSLHRPSYLKISLQESTMRHRPRQHAYQFTRLDGVLLSIFAVGVMMWAIVNLS